MQHSMVESIVGQVSFELGVEEKGVMVLTDGKSDDDECYDVWNEKNLKENDKNEVVTMKQEVVQKKPWCISKWTITDF